MPKKLSSPATGKQKNATSGRPVRSTRGTGGQRAQLERTSVIVGEGLLNKVTGQKRDRNNLVAIPENLSENDLAPPIPAKRARTTKTVIIIHLLFFCLKNVSHRQIGSSASIQDQSSGSTSPSRTQARSDIRNKRVSIWISYRLWQSTGRPQSQSPSQ
jgi:hypothetical protein